MSALAPLLDAPLVVVALPILFVGVVVAVTLWMTAGAEHRNHRQ